jgi:hypothetical protein
MVMKHNKDLFEDPVFYICKGYRPFSTCEKNWLCWFILRQCLHVVFPSHSFLVEHELPVVVTKTMEFHVLPHLELLFLLVHKFATIVFASFDIWMFRGGIDTFTLVINYLDKI